MTAFHNPCGGVGWRTLSNGQIEVEGRGVPLASGQFATYVRQSWTNFAPEILAAAHQRHVPVSWVLAIVSVETGLWSGSRDKQAAARSSCCVGPAAVMLSNYKLGGYASSQALYDPAANIDTGAAILRLWLQKGYDLPAVAARYNSGGLCCPTAPATASSGARVRNEFSLCSAAIAGVSYPMMAIQANNYALASGLVPTQSSLLKVLGVGLGILGVGAAVAIAVLPRDTLQRYGI